MGMRSHLYEPERDFGRYVDFSTPPFRLGQGSAFIIVDVSDTVSKYCRMNPMVSFYHKFPLHEIMEMLLSFSLSDAAHSPGHWDVLSDWTSERLGHKDDSLHTDCLYIFYESLINDLEREISIKAPEYVSTGDYVFYNWWDPVSIVLTRERLKELE